MQGWIHVPEKQALELLKDDDIQGLAHLVRKYYDDDNPLKVKKDLKCPNCGIDLSEPQINSLGGTVRTISLYDEGFRPAIIRKGKNFINLSISDTSDPGDEFTDAECGNCARRLDLSSLYSVVDDVMYDYEGSF